ncbi:TRAP transporter substrate-binding protein [Halalkalibacterium halodurans]|uniref:TRAP transporter substrate-binding protein n=1 Tax=Halalkalibacterium halodurans TaxID=86665 RepID=UPI0010FD5ADB|nr:TRAP transporter substrate-binding protein [Halalkalibacterium halodurans]MDY7223301.1 TRAP transporter substrate-binding protein [Halalkalibacterium halodurans]MDY7242522.1 TRAP transporter substrate-binding protein [Halalkalibacterium halodurans]
MKHIWTVSFILLGIVTALYIGFGAERESEGYAIEDELDGLNEKVVLHFSHITAENTPKGLAVTHFAQLVREKTDGWVDIQVFPNGILFTAQEEFVALKEQEVHIIAPAFSEISLHDPKWLIMDMPYLFEDEEMLRAVFDGEVGEALFASLSEQGYHGLSFWENGFKQFTNNVRPIRTPEDLEGLSMRVMPSEALMKTFDHFGGIPKPFAFNEVYERLSEGAIDGTENSLTNIYSKKFYRQQAYMTKSNHNYLGYAILMDQTVWDKLPIEYQTAIEEAMAETTMWLRDHVNELNEGIYELLKESDQIEVYELTPEEKQQWKEAVLPIYEYYERQIGEDLFEKVRQLQSE